MPRPIPHDPAQAEAVEEVVIPHLHYDHAGGLGRLVPGHHPLVMQCLAPEGRSGFVWGLGPGPVR